MAQQGDGEGGRARRVGKQGCRSRAHHAPTAIGRSRFLARGDAQQQHCCSRFFRRQRQTTAGGQVVQAGVALYLGQHRTRRPAACNIGGGAEQCQCVGCMELKTQVGVDPQIGQSGWIKPPLPASSLSHEEKPSSRCQPGRQQQRKPPAAGAINGLCGKNLMQCVGRQRFVERVDKRSAATHFAARKGTAAGCQGKPRRQLRRIESLNVHIMFLS